VRISVQGSEGQEGSLGLHLGGDRGGTWGSLGVS
jgi:hypothetical protein